MFFIIALIIAIRGIICAYYTIDVECDIHKCIKILHFTMFATLAFTIVGIILKVFAVLWSIYGGYTVTNLS